jgi:hypothetical protein
LFVCLFRNDTERVAAAAVVLLMKTDYFHFFNCAFGELSTLDTRNQCACNPRPFFVPCRDLIVGVCWCVCGGGRIKAAIKAKSFAMKTDTLEQL